MAKSETKESIKETQFEQPFYINTTKLNAEKNAFSRQQNYLQKAVDTYQRVTGHNLASYDEVRQLIQDPHELFANYNLNKDAAQTSKLQELFGSIGLSLKTLAENAVAEVAGFAEVEKACARVRDERVSLKMFTLTEGNIELCDEFYTRQIGKTIFIASTPQQRKRLKYTDELIEMTLRQNAFLKEEMEAAGMRGKYAAKEQSLDHIGPVPYPIRVEITYNENGHAVRKLVPNEEWVVNGYRQLFPDKRRFMEQPREPKVYRVALVKQGDGSKGMQLFEPNQPVPIATLRVSKTRVLPDLYILENGALKPIGKGERLPEHPLVTQL